MKPAIEKLPADKFGFAHDESVQLLYETLDNHYPQIKASLAASDLTTFINLLSAYSTAYVEQMAADHKDQLQSVDDYFSPARNFISFYHENQALNEKGVLKQLSERTIIEYTWVYLLCLQHKKRYLELMPGEKKKENRKRKMPDEIDDIIEQTKFTVVRCFISNLLSDKHKSSADLSFRRLNLAVQTQIKAIIDVMAEKEGRSDCATLTLVREKLMKIHDRLKEAVGFFNQDPQKKMDIILTLYAATTKTVDFFHQELEKTLRDSEITQHRNYFSRNCLIAFFKTPTSVKELRDIQKFCLSKKTPVTMRRLSYAAADSQ